MRKAIKFSLIVLLWGWLPQAHGYGKGLAQDSAGAALKIWDSDTGRLIFNFATQKGVTSITYSPDGKIIAAASSDGKVRLWNVSDGRKVGEFDAQAGAVQSVVFSRDGKKLASGHWGRVIVLWDIPTGRVMQRLTGREAVLSIALSPDGLLVASGGLDKNIQVWEISSGRALHTLRGHSEVVRSVSFSRDGKILASGSDDNTVKLWSVQTGKELATLQGHTGPVGATIFSHDGKLVASGDDETIRVWNLNTNSPRIAMRGHSSSVNSISFSTDGTRLVSGSYDQTVKVWEVSTGRLLKTFDNVGGVVTSVAFSPDGKTLASSSVPARSSNPTLHLLVVGIDSHHLKALRPLYAEKDARDFVTAFERLAKNKFERISTHVLLGKDATQKGIEAAFMKVIAEAKTSDTFVFFYSGKGQSLGQRADSAPQFYLLPSNLPSQSPNVIRKRGVSAPLLQSWLNRIQARHQLLILDSSRSSKGFNTFITRLRREEKLIEDFHIRDTAILAVTGISFEFDSIQNGLLTYTVLQCLTTGCNSSRADLTAKDLINFTVGKTPQFLKQFHNPVSRKWVRKYPNSAGKVTYYTAGKDFPLGSFKTDASALEKGELDEASPARRGQRVNSVIGGQQAGERRGRVGTKLIRKRDYQATVTGKNHALLFGTNEYDHWKDLPNPLRDAQAIANELKENYGFDSPVVVPNATKRAIIDNLLAFQKIRYAPEDHLFIFFAGHGDYIEAFNQGYIVAKDSKENDEIGESYLDFALFHRIINVIPCEHIYLVVDSCFSGTLTEARYEGEGYDPAHTSAADLGRKIKYEARRHQGSDLPSLSAAEYFERKARLKTRKYLASGGKEYVPDGRPGHHSPFATRFLAALKSKGGAKGYMTVKEINAFMVGLDPVAVDDEWGDDERGSDFIFIVIKPGDRVATPDRAQGFSAAPLPLR